MPTLIGGLKVLSSRGCTKIDKLPLNVNWTLRGGRGRRSRGKETVTRIIKDRKNYYSSKCVFKCFLKMEYEKLVLI